VPSGARAKLVAHHLVEEPGLVPEEAGHHATVAARRKRRSPVRNLPEAVLHLVFEDSVVVLRARNCSPRQVHAARHAYGIAIGLERDAAVRHFLHERQAALAR
jgi:hypothetical protein